jgi:hypothetical protein
VTAAAPCAAAAVTRNRQASIVASNFSADTVGCRADMATASV